MGKTKAKIMVINTDPVFLQLMDDLLTEHGYNTIPWREGKTAYEIIKKERPDLLILDIRLTNPEEGWQLVEVLKFDPHTRRIPIIIASADRQFLESKEPILRQKGCFTLEKPFELEDLLARVRQALSSSSENGEAGDHG
jgi:DNA-binding response OmpR family regulator